MSHDTVPSVKSQTFSEYLETIRDQPVYVILGVQGSGTNLLGRIMVKVFGFSLLRDRSSVLDAAIRLGPSPTPAAVDREIAYFESLLAPGTIRQKLDPMVIYRREPFKGLIPELRKRTITSGAEFARLIHAYRAYSLGTTLMAVKSDDMWRHIERIDEAMPNRRILLLTRDFRDNIMSVKGKSFGPVEPVCVAEYVKHHFGYYEHQYRRAGDRGYHVKFETLVGHREHFVEEFGRTFGLRPIEDTEKALGKVPVRPNKTAKWRALSPRDLAWCEALLRDELRRFGYEPAAEPVPPPAGLPMLVARVRDAVRRTPQKIGRVAGRLRS